MTAPVLLDNKSGFSGRQVRRLNSILKSQMNLFQSRAVQEQLKDTAPADPLMEWSGSVSYISALKYRGMISAWVEMGIPGYVNGESFFIARMDSNLKTCSVSGSLDTDGKYPVSLYMQVEIRKDEIWMKVISDIPSDFDSMIIYISAEAQ